MQFIMGVTMKVWNRLACAVAFCCLAASTESARAADHNDAPDIMGAEGSFVDITDVFVFRSPVNPENLVLYYGLFTPEVAGEAKLFATNARYEIYLDTNGDQVADRTIRTTFSDNADGSQTYRMTGVPSANNISGAVSIGSEPVVTVDGPAKAFCGIRGDQFFFDLDAFKHFVSAPCVPTAGLRCPGDGPPSDFFAGRNTATIAVEFPTTALPGITSATSGSVNVWAKTFTE